MNQQLKRLSSKTAKTNNLKNQIQMRVLGLQYHDMAHAWSKDGKAHSPEVLAAHLKLLAKEEAKRGTNTPPSSKRITHIWNIDT